jgi:hypothetical protein
MSGVTLTGLGRHVRCDLRAVARAAERASKRASEFTAARRITYPTNGVSMMKPMFLVLGLLVLTATALMVIAAPDSARNISGPATMDVQALERSID